MVLLKPRDLRFYPLPSQIYNLINSCWPSSDHTIDKTIKPKPFQILLFHNVSWYSIFTSFLNIMFMKWVITSICLNHIHKISKAQAYIFVWNMTVYNIFSQNILMHNNIFKQTSCLKNAHTTYPLPESRGCKRLGLEKLECPCSHHLNDWSKLITYNSTLPKTYTWMTT